MSKNAPNFVIATGLSKIFSQMQQVIKPTLLVFWVISSSFITPIKERSHWLEDFQKAQEAAKAENKPILMVFAGSDWCKPCILLDREVFENEAFINFAEKELVLLKLDFPRKRKNAISKEIKKQHEKLAERYNTEGAFPLVLLLNHQGEVLQTIQHQNNQPQNFIEQIQKILNQ